MAVHVNSLIAYYDNIQKFSKRECEILGCFVKNGNEPMTDRNIKAVLNYADMNYIRPRVSDMIKRGVMIETGKIEDNVTHESVRLVKIKERAEGQGMLNFAKPS